MFHVLNILNRHFYFKQKSSFISLEQKWCYNIILASKWIAFIRNLYIVKLLPCKFFVFTLSNINNLKCNALLVLTSAIFLVHSVRKPS